MFKINNNFLVVYYALFQIIHGLLLCFYINDPKQSLNRLKPKDEWHEQSTFFMLGDSYTDIIVIIFALAGCILYFCLNNYGKSIILPTLYMLHYATINFIITHNILFQSTQNVEYILAWGVFILYIPLIVLTKRLTFQKHLL